MKILVNDSEHLIFTNKEKFYMITETEDNKFMVYDFGVKKVGQTQVNKIAIVEGEGRLKVADTILDGTIEWYLQHQTKEG